MGFTAKTKTLSRLAGLNYLYRVDNKDFGTKLNQDPVLVAQQKALALIITSIKTKALGDSTTVPTPDCFPCPTGRWMGRLAFDTVTKGAGKDKDGDATVVYKYDNAAAIALNANTFRGRCDDLVKFNSMENDMINAAEKPNPGGQAGVHGDAPVAPGLNKPAAGQQ